MADIMGLLKPGWQAGGLARLAVYLMVLSWVPGAGAAALTHHSLQVRLHPAQNSLQVEDTITLADGADPRDGLRFSLHAGLNPRVLTPGATLRPEAAAAYYVPMETYSVSLPAGSRSFTLRYQGPIHHPLQAEGTAAVRGELSTAGSITEEGVFLAGSTAWFPNIGSDLFTFQLDVELPRGWQAISQGRRTRHDVGEKQTHVTWTVDKPQEDLYLVAAPFTEYQRQAGDVLVQVFLRSPEPELAERYLAASGPYLAMYERLIGAYPYAKFALVENFWETGYGMPSFTLMGPRIIRFPFILYTSYPHEILHNWWGNGVYVDYRQGNWSEGLTAYLSDHLLQEQRGKAVDYRRTTLQKYTDYVASARDFPITAFRGRHDNASEAIGYGKTLMFFHMLRRQVGDERFKAALQRFYSENVFRRAAFSDLVQAFKGAGHAGSNQAFTQWVTGTGAPQLRIAEARAIRQQGMNALELVLEQRQPGEAYTLDVPVAITLDGQAAAYETTIAMKTKRQRFTLQVPGHPLRVDVDPQFDLFRRLDRSEVPPALSQLFGAEKVLMVLPGRAPQELLAGYRRLAESWRQPGVATEIKLDSSLQDLPKDRAVWVFGWENRFRDTVARSLDGFDVGMEPKQVRLEGQSWERGANSLVLTAPHDAAQTIGWLGADNAGALPGLARKLPHYGKYSYLAFAGDEPGNVLKGMWTPPDSVMAAAVVQPDGRHELVAPAALAPRTPLIASPGR